DRRRTAEGRGQTHQPGPGALHPRDGRPRTGSHGAHRRRHRLGNDRHQLRPCERTPCPRALTTADRHHPQPITRRKQNDVDLDKLMSKHLSRYFDNSKTIPEETLQQLLRFLRSAPTSTNIQPNHFYVLATQEGKERLAANLGERFQDNAEKVLNASHTII